MRRVPEAPHPAPAPLAGSLMAAALAGAATLGALAGLGGHWLREHGAPPWSAWGLVLALAALAAWIWALSRRLLEPLQELVAWAQALARGDGRLGAPTSAYREAAELGLALDELGDRLARDQEALRNERARLSALLAAHPDPVFAVDREGKLLFSNPAARNLLSPGGDLPGRSLLGSLRDWQLSDTLTTTVQSGQPQACEIRLRVPVERVYMVHSAPVPSLGGEAAGAVAVLRDVTELRRLEKVRTDFVANVSHELRTPLTAIKGFVETLLDGALEEPAAARRFLEIIGQETDRLVALVNDLLELARLEDPEAPLQVTPVQLRPLIEETAALFTARLHAKGLALWLDLPSELPPVPGDADLLRQVLVNLLDNAIKYTPEGGRIAVRVRQEEARLHLAVSDTGPGIAAHHLPRLFERFYRVDRGRSRAMGGTGLGLAIVKHIAERHGGSVSVESEPGRGSTFTVTLPLAAPAAGGGSSG